MPDFRAYFAAGGAIGPQLRLEAGESHHLVAVNRCQRGDPVVAFDGRGHEWLCACADPNKSSAVLDVKSARPAAVRTREVTLAQVLPKGSAMDDIVRQATEIGVARIVPLVSERTQVRLEAERADRKIEKWRTGAVEAAKQCGNPWLPEIAPVQELAAFLAAAKAIELKLVASLHAGAISLKKAGAHFRATHAREPRSVAWLIGPEGDFSPAEMTAAVLAGFSPVTLGPLVLRCDTAVVYALGALAAELAPA
jgi:16S rRNA (uracil1498-N3)-methyltransferase